MGRKNADLEVWEFRKCRKHMEGMGCHGREKLHALQAHSGYSGRRAVCASVTIDFGNQFLPGQLDIVVAVSCPETETP